MDSFTLNTFGIVVPFAIFTLVFGLALGPIANRLAKWRQSL
ncbi:MULTISPECIES: hypothetical protein [Komagataeibacter]|mgnify:FL=1|uniref:Uncharacterized protein n=1 Tax=Komagataeibacter saccharivorans TaxID=265959 RepID=A0A347WH18_9PROT|nr:MULTISPECIES: hypothetical protein [Komagataeibacter]AXY24161.1 hypothetical protein CD178_03417 [Komagataeibacter saccharivorans]QBL95594.1 hypothetical protein KSAC_34150 [Komagataeibacter saccharivorans]